MKEGKNPKVLSATTIMGDKVVNPEGEDVGKIKELMIDMDYGRVAYAVLQFGGILGLGDKLFAIPWEALELDAPKHRFILDVDKEVLENAEGFDQNDWPDMANHEWGLDIYSHYGYKPYWD